jgi:Protein of unknown function (DUF1592)/Protein of unknown function (DUF1588)/Protein of unknown function (DUF1585)/Protein of unknown function (DUF1587)/Protein of unknown function (DUF1595)
MGSRHSSRFAGTTKVRLFLLGAVVWIAARGTTVDTTEAGQQPHPAAGVILEKYCVRCHNAKLRTAGFAIDESDLLNSQPNAQVWETVLKQLRAGMMPPAGSLRPDKAAYRSLMAELTDILDRAALASPRVGRSPVHRLNRFEYTNSIRDLFGFDIDGQSMLPGDDSGFGFDNIADVLTTSPGLLERYLHAATTISSLAVGDPAISPSVTTYALPDLTLGQDDRMSEELPFGSRGGLAVRHYFPLDGEYSLRITLARSDLAAGDLVRGMAARNQIDVRLDRARVTSSIVGGPGSKQVGGSSDVEVAADGGLGEIRFTAKAGMHTVAVAFNQDIWATEGVGVDRFPLTSNAFAQARNTSPASGKIEMAIRQIDIAGPFSGRVPVDGPVRRRLFVCRPSKHDDEDRCATQILSTLAHRAFRRPPTDAEVTTLLAFYHRGRTDGTFDSGIQAALTRLLVDPSFLFRRERDPEGAVPGSLHRVSDLDLASRLSFFLWSSIPDDELLNAAERGDLQKPAILEQQVRRMMKDDRASAIVNSFFGQWLALRNLAVARPNPAIFPEFDENLRAAFQRETTLFLESQLRDDRPALELLTANYTFVNERLARHYGIPGVLGSHFRRVKYIDDTRGGLFGQGSVLTVTSYANRTSVVLRGKWIMEHVLGTEPPPPPESVPSLDGADVKGSVRQQMEAHRKNPSCAACHAQIDPLGFALENFDGIGHFRTSDGNAAIDASGAFVDGTTFDNPAAFRRALVERQDAFLATLTENLLTYALGRGVEPSDEPAVRRILRDAAPNAYRWSAIILATVNSVPFQMRTSQP